jgi:major membrane immunogen (membrane-anchored lipoprotein)
MSKTVALLHAILTASLLVACGDDDKVQFTRVVT